MKKWKQTAGFTLVELIVVIAILGILAGVGTVGYSGYIKKANKAVDEQLISDVKYALELGLVTDKPADFEGGVIVTLSQNDAPAVTSAVNKATDVAFAEKALENMFGDGWTALRLKYSGWKAGSEAAVEITQKYVGSSFDGNEADLLDQVQNLSSTLALVVHENPNVIGTNFSGWLDANNLSGASGTTVGNAAVLYVADNAANMNAEGQQALSDAICNYFVRRDPGQIIAATGSTAAACAAIYAITDAYCQYEKANGNNAPLTALNEGTANLSSAEDVDEALGIIGDAFTSAMNGLQNPNGTPNAPVYKRFLKYTYGFTDEEVEAAMAGEPVTRDLTRGVLCKDAEAYIATLNAISNSKDTIMPNLGSSQCYTDGTALQSLKLYIVTGADGQVALLVSCNAEGIADVTVNAAD